MGRAWAVVAASAAGYAAVLAWVTWQLPDRVALHVNADGVVNRYGSRLEAVSGFIGIGAFLILLAVAVVCTVCWTPATLLNIPHKDYWSTPERLPTARRMLAVDVALMFSMPILFFSCLVVDTALTTADPAGFSALWILVPLGLMFLGMGLCVVRMLGRRYRARTDGHRDAP